MADEPTVDAVEPAHTAVDLARWLVANPVPPGSARSVAKLDAQIARERDAWG